MKAPNLDASTVAILAVAVVGGVLLWRWGDKLGEGVKDLATGSVDMVGGVLTGSNTVTQTARTNAYEGAGILGTLGAATDHLSGGTLSRFGEWLGEKTYDLTH